MGSIRVLVIDDEPAILEALSEFLEDEGYEVLLSRDGEEALRIFESIGPELAIVDLRMPGLSGTDVIRTMKNSNRNTAVIVITAYGSLEVAIDLFRLRVFDFIQKPLDLDYLRDVLKRAHERLKTSDQTRNELNFLRKQLAVAHQRLQEAVEMIPEVKSLALGARLLAEMVCSVDGRIECETELGYVPDVIRSKLQNLTGITAEAANVDEVVGSILEHVKSLETSKGEWLHPMKKHHKE